LTDTLATLAIALGASWASGINPYAAILLMGGAQLSGLVTLPHDLQVLGSAWVLAAAALLFVLNFFADKIPLVDSMNDALHTFVRIPAGALLAFGAADSLGPQAGTIAALLGGTLAATSHAAKATTRAAVNASPEPFSNIALSLLGDAAVPTMLWLAFSHPVWFFVALAIALALMVGLTVALFKFLRALVRSMRARFAPTQSVVP